MEDTWVCAMSCSQEARLRTFYDDALERWARVQAELRFFESHPSRIELLMEDLAEEKEAARNRWEMHRQNCSRCRRAATLTPSGSGC